MLKTVDSLRVKIFADGADKEAIIDFNKNPLISGFTTNPTLMRRAGVTDYETFSREVIAIIKDKPISLEVFSDQFDEMEKQATAIASWGDNVFVKVAITNTKGEPSLPLIRSLSARGIKQNITAMTTYEQVESVVPALSAGAGGIVSVLGGRIADSGRDPLPTMCKCLELLKGHKNVELLWASPRELYNIIQADDIGCHIITVTSDILKKLPLMGGNLDHVSLDTVKMFYNDAIAAKFSIVTD